MKNAHKPDRPAITKMKMAKYVSFSMKNIRAKPNRIIESAPK